MATVQSSWWQRTKFSFKESNYITDAWNWLLKLLSKSAEPILFFTVLYSGYELLPGVPQPGPMIDAPVFIVQQAALDIGGLGLMKIAKQVNLGKESYAYRVGMILIVLMIVNVAMASLKKVVTLPPIAFTVIETILLMARAVMAVLYGHAIHSLRDEFPQVVSQQSAPDFAQVEARLQEKIGQIEAKVSEQIQEKLSQHLTEITQQTQIKLDEVLSQISTQTSPQTQSNVVGNSAENLDETQDEFDRETDHNLRTVSPQKKRQTRDTSGSKTYALTKREAAQRLHCSIKDIEKGIEDGKIKLYANSEKVLVSSLKNFTPTRRLRVVNS